MAGFVAVKDKWRNYLNGHLAYWKAQDGCQNLKAAALYATSGAKENFGKMPAVVKNLYSADRPISGYKDVPPLASNQWHNNGATISKSTGSGTGANASGETSAAGAGQQEHSSTTPGQGGPTAAGDTSTAGNGGPADVHSQAAPAAHAPGHSCRDPRYVLNDFDHDPGEANGTFLVPELDITEKAVFKQPHDAAGSLGDEVAGFIEALEKIMKKAPKEGDGGVWKREKEVGRGSFGTVNKWVLKEGSNVIETIVAKDILVGEYWPLITTWSSDLRDVPREVAAHRSLSARPDTKAPAADNADQCHDPTGEEYILKYKGFRLNRLLKMFRIAAPFAEYGSAESFFSAFWPGDYKHVDNKMLPNVQLMRRIFRAMAEGCRRIERMGIVHRDLKQPNILLDSEEADSLLPGYGFKPLIADFGTCVPIKPKRYVNPEDFDCIQTPAFGAPEQFSTIPPVIPADRNATNGRPADAYALNGKTDVFALGVTYFNILRGLKLAHFKLVDGKRVEESVEVDSSDEEYEDDRKDENGKKKTKVVTYEPHWLWHRDPVWPKMTEEDEMSRIRAWMDLKFHSWPKLHAHWTDKAPDLLATIARCLRYHPDDRLSLDDLIGELDKQIEDGSDPEDPAARKQMIQDMVEELKQTEIRIEKRGKAKELEKKRKAEEQKKQREAEERAKDAEQSDQEPDETRRAGKRRKVIEEDEEELEVVTPGRKLRNRRQRKDDDDEDPDWKE